VTPNATKRGRKEIPLGGMYPVFRHKWVVGGDFWV